MFAASGATEACSHDGARDAARPSGVIVGAMLAHACANTTAVVGGEMLGKHISEKIMALSGAVVFSVFAVASLWKGLTAEEVPLT